MFNVFFKNFSKISETYLERSKRMSCMLLNMSRTTSKKFGQKLFFFFPDFFRNGGSLKNDCFGHVCPSAPMSFFWKIIGTKKMWDVCMIIFVAVSRRDLCYVSEDEGSHFYERGPFMENIPWSLSLYNCVCGHKIDMAIYIYIYTSANPCIYMHGEERTM